MKTVVFERSQTLQGLTPLSFNKNWSEFQVDTDLCVQPTRTAVSHLIQFFEAELQTLTETGWYFSF